MPKRLDLTNRKFGRLTAISTDGTGRRSNWKCECECGGVVFAETSWLTSGNTKSCGCLQREKAKASCQAKKTHGMSTSRLARILHSMRQRCTYEKSINFADYGGRGIRVCEEWTRNADAFFTWASANGYADDLTIDRIDVNGDYSPENCRWASMKEQQNNRRNNVVIEFRGKTQTAKQWAEELGIKYTTLRHRQKAGWSMEKIAATPVAVAA